MMKNKVLIVSNPLNHEGGIVNYYNLFLKHFKSDDFELQHFVIGSRSYLFYYPLLKKILYPVYFFLDYIRFILILLFNSRIKIIQLSPSLIPVPLLRDGVLLLTAKLFNKKVIVFYRGWKLPVLEKIVSSKILTTIFYKLYQTNTQQIVLASSFKNDLQKIGISNAPIIVTTTAIDKSDIIIKKREIGEKFEVLFLGRIQNLKGVEEIIDAIIHFKNNEELKYFHFTFVGHEDKSGYIDSLKNKLALYQINDSQVVFTGRITGKEKFKMYSSHDIFLLPSYTEGCPNSVLEALASGLFCITTGVGALYDIIENKKNGLLIQEKSGNEIVNALLYCKNNRALLNNRIENAKIYSQKFNISAITLLFNNIYLKLYHAK